MAHDVVALGIDDTGTLNDESMLLVELLQRGGEDGKACNAVTAARHAAEGHSLRTQAVVFGQNALCKKLLEALEVVEDAGLTIDEIVDDVIVLRGLKSNRGLLSHGQVDDRLDDVEAAGILDEQIFHVSARARAEFKNGNVVTVVDHLNEHGGIDQSERIGVVGRDPVIALTVGLSFNINVSNK